MSDFKVGVYENGKRTCLNCRQPEKELSYEEASKAVNVPVNCRYYNCETCRILEYIYE